MELHNPIPQLLPVSGNLLKLSAWLGRFQHAHPKRDFKECGAFSVVSIPGTPVDICGMGLSVKYPVLLRTFQAQGRLFLPKMVILSSRTLSSILALGLKISGEGMPPVSCPLGTENREMKNWCGWAITAFRIKFWARFDRRVLVIVLQRWLSVPCFVLNQINSFLLCILDGSYININGEIQFCGFLREPLRHMDEGKLWCCLKITELLFFFKT